MGGFEASKMRRSHKDLRPTGRGIPESSILRTLAFSVAFRLVVGWGPGFGVYGFGVALGLGFNGFIQQMSLSFAFTCLFVYRVEASGFGGWELGWLELGFFAT